jgi:hypothetical protein
VGTTSTSAFIEAFRSANLGLVLEKLSTLSSLAHSSSSPEEPHKLQLHSAYTTAGQAFDSLLRETAETVEALREAEGEVGAFRLGAEHDVRRLGIEKLRPAGFEDAKKHVSNVLSRRYAWWKLAFRMDDVGPELKGEVARTYLTEFEQQVGPIVSSFCNSEKYR